MKFRYTCKGEQFKGNTHIHSTMSDGNLTYQELADLYSSTGYHFIFTTDHRYTEDTSRYSKDNFIMIGGIELDGSDSRGSDYHVVGLDYMDPYDPDTPLEQGMKLLQEHGSFLILAHPHWTENTFEDCIRHPFDAVEIYNNVCHTMNGKSICLAHWDFMLANNMNVLAIAADDAHISKTHPHHNGGWIVAIAEELSKEAVMDSIKKGCFYSSTGPDILDISMNGNELSIETSPVKFIRLTARNGFNRFSFARENETIQKAVFDLSDLDESDLFRRRVRVEIEDAGSKRAWSNTLFI